MKYPARLLASLSLLLGLAASAVGADAPAGRAWIPLFNGKNLDGWTIKITNHPLGENYADTFRV